METEADLLSEIEAFIAAHGIAVSTFGLRAVNDGKFVKRLREGAGITMATARKVRRFIQDSGAVGE